MLNRTVFSEDMFMASVSTDKPHRQEDAGSLNLEEQVLEENEMQEEATTEKLIIPQFTETCDLTDLPSTSSGLPYFSPEQIAPYPKITKEKNTKLPNGRGENLTH
ncbi:hypothetical protein JTB14_022094 [Gonioctena quinquepunctata]|nr:hypothetical protein JTB14_022094 [Gonioctena quinquepunctata]